MKVRHKLVGAFLAAAALAATPGGLVLYADAASARQAAIREAQDVANGIAKEVSYAPPGVVPLLDDPAALAKYLQRLHDLQNRDIAVVNRDLTILGDVIPASVGEKWDEDDHNQVAATIADGTRRTFVETTADYPDGIQQVVVPITGASNAVEGAVVLEYTPLYRQMAEVTRDSQRVTIVAAPICVVLVLLLGTLVARSITRRIKLLTEAVKVLRQGNYAHRTELRGSDEIAALGHAFDDMARRLDSSAHESLPKDYTDSILANAREGIWGVDAGNRITFANAAAGRMTGLGVDGLVGQDACKLLPATDPRNDTDYEREGTLQRPDGTAVRVVFTISRVAADGGAVVVLRDVSRQHGLENDALTGLPNRKLFLDRLVQATFLAQSADHAVAVLYLDLDGFKEINEAFDHNVGDALLLKTAERLAAQVRPQDMVARLGGDEFAVLLDGVAPREAEEVAKACVAALREPHQVDGREAVVAASMGVVPDTTHYSDANEILRHAVAAMYAAKAQGKARYQVFESRIHAAAQD